MNSARKYTNGFVAATGALPMIETFIARNQGVHAVWCKPGWVKNFKRKILRVFL